MAVALADLLPTPSKEEILERLLRQLRGLGWTRHSAGKGTGWVDAVDGTPANDFDVVLTITTAGVLGGAVFTYSTDGGLTISGTTVIPISGEFVLPGTGVTLQWRNGTQSIPLSFLVGDTFVLALRKNGFPVTAWQPLSVPLSMVENDAEALADLYKLTSNIGNGGFMLLAAQAGLDQWVEIHAQQFYNEAPIEGVTTKGVVRFTDAQNQGPFTRAAGEITVATAFGLKFLNDAGFTIPLGGYVDVAVTAEAVGTDYNVGNGTITALVTALSGVTVNNPDPGSGTWLTRAGTNRETASALAQRCVDKWKKLGTGTPTGVYDTWAKEAGQGVVKTAAYVSSTTPGMVDLYVSGANGPLTSPQIAAVQAYVQALAPLTVLVNVLSPSVVVVNIAGNAYVDANFTTQAQAEASANLTALFEALPIGGTLWFSALVDAFQKATGVRNIVLSSPVVDVVLAANTIATFTNSVAWVEV